MPDAGPPSPEAAGPAPGGTAPGADKPERRVARDMARRGLLVGPLLVLVCALVWGLDGLWSALLAFGLVILNFLAGAAIIGWLARSSPALLMSGVLGGYVLRLGIITAVVVPIRNADWFDKVPFAIVLLVLHLGLLVWELRYVAGSLAHPGLHPDSGVLRAGRPKQPKRGAAHRKRAARGQGAGPKGRAAGRTSAHRTSAGAVKSEVGAGV